MTAIPAETRMGKGKGEVEFWAAVVKPGTILYEVSGLSEEKPPAQMFARVAHKMPVDLPVRRPQAHPLIAAPGSCRRRRLVDPRRMQRRIPQ